MDLDLQVIQDSASTEVGSYFVANYPPFSVWSAEHLPAARSALDRPAAVRRAEDHGRLAPLGLYLHIPFCRKRCKFCYFRVYTDKNSSEVDVYMHALAKEAALYADRPGLAGRDFDFVYFGGGTPSFLSSEQLERLVDRIREYWQWERAREVTFECEPGTLKKGKLRTIKSIGVTRLSLGIEHLDDEVLSLNGRAHKSPEVFRAYDWARDVGFEQINVDLIAGMMGDNEALWKETVHRTLELRPDSLTVYQMELPHNTVISKHAKETGEPPPIADWKTKREWADYAFGLFEDAGYVVSSAYTVVKPSDRSGFVYRNAVWRGADMVGTGVASFSHFGGVHYQNVDTWEEYVGMLERGELPLSRALPVTDGQRLIRELVLQLKLGRLDAAYFRDKFHVEIAGEFGDAFGSLIADGYAEIDGDDVRLTRAGLLRVDALLPRFFEPAYRNVRYT
jgi:oxygen-independent coproporphyrinogen-3 oxidase